MTVYLPDIGGLLPVYVVDEYEGFRVKTFAELTDDELGRLPAVRTSPPSATSPSVPAAWTPPSPTT